VPIKYPITHSSTIVFPNDPNAWNPKPKKIRIEKF
jgi:hypothetical protein